MDHSEGGTCLLHHYGPRPSTTRPGYCTYDPLTLVLAQTPNLEEEMLLKEAWGGRGMNYLLAKSVIQLDQVPNLKQSGPRQSLVPAQALLVPNPRRYPYTKSLESETPRSNLIMNNGLVRATDFLQGTRRNSCYRKLEVVRYPSNLSKNRETKGNLLCKLGFEVIGVFSCNPRSSCLGNFLSIYQDP